jgi:NAD-dependent deacetylase
VADFSVPREIDPELIGALRAARAVVVLTGAGISAESGVPTFRDAQSGLWGKYRPEDLATPEAFQRNPKLVWEWYAWRRERAHSVSPNAGHVALAEMERRLPSFTLVTQNVDNLHRRAGSTNIIELHGNITRVKCFENNHPAEKWSEATEAPPRCAKCGGRLRPDVVWFGENLPDGVFEGALAATYECSVFFSIGTSSLVYPAAALPLAALERGAIVVEVNPNATSLARSAHYAFAEPSGEFLPRLVAATWPS